MLNTTAILQISFLNTVPATGKRCWIALIVSLQQIINPEGVYLSLSFCDYLPWILVSDFDYLLLRREKILYYKLRCVSFFVNEAQCCISLFSSTMNLARTREVLAQHLIVYEQSSILRLTAFIYLNFCPCSESALCNEISSLVYVLQHFVALW